MGGTTARCQCLQTAGGCAGKGLSAGMHKGCSRKLAARWGGEAFAYESLSSREDRRRNTGAADGSVCRSPSLKGYMACGDAQVSAGLECGDQPGPSSAASPPRGQQPRPVLEDSAGELCCRVVDSACPLLPSTISYKHLPGTAARLGMPWAGCRAQCRCRSSGNLG